MMAYRLATLGLGMMAVAAYLIPQTMQPLPYTEATALARLLPSLGQHAGEGCVVSHQSNAARESCMFDQAPPVDDISLQLQRQGWKNLSTGPAVHAWCKDDQAISVEHSESWRVVFKRSPDASCA